MKLILCRHGLAMDRAVSVTKKMEDNLRPLTDKGKKRSDLLAQSILNQNCDPNLLVSSPYVRAMQTAEILYQSFSTVEIHECMDLVPSAPPQAFAQWLKKYAKSSTTIVAVGHEPQLSVFASWVLAGLTESFIDLKKSGALCLEFESFEDIYPRCATLKWAINPKSYLDK